MLAFVLSSDSYGEGNGTPLQYSCLENPMDGGAAVHGVTKSRTRLRDFTSLHCIIRKNCNLKKKLFEYFSKIFYFFAFFIIFYLLFMFSYDGSLLLCRLFSHCRGWRLLSRCSVQASRCSGFCCRGVQGLPEGASGIAAPGL